MATPKWASEILRDKDKDNDTTLSNLLLPKFTILQNPKISRQDQCGDICAGLLEIAKRNPSIFGRKCLLKGLLELLKWTNPAPAPPPRDGFIQHTLACTLFMAGFDDKETWPVEFVRAYLDDAFDKRLWVDLNQASVFVSNIVTAFGAPNPIISASSTTQPKPPLDEPEQKRRKVHESPTLQPSAPPPGGAPSTQYFDELSGAGSTASTAPLTSELPPVRPRYRGASLQAEVRVAAVDACRVFMDARGDAMGDRRLKSALRVLPLLVGLEPVRYQVASRLEAWLNNPNAARHARELVTRLANSCTLDTDSELTTMRTLARLRPKPHAAPLHQEVGARCAADWLLFFLFPHHVLLPPRWQNAAARDAEVSRPRCRPCVTKARWCLFSTCLAGCSAPGLYSRLFRVHRCRASRSHR